MGFSSIVKSSRNVAVIACVVLSFSLGSTLGAFPVDALSPAIVDVRSVAMGNTASVSATGSNAIFYNPALLADMKSFEIQSGGRLSFGDADNESARGSLFEAKYQTVKSFTHLSAAVPIRIEDYLTLFTAFGYHLHLDGARNEKFDWVHEMGELHFTDTMTGGFATLTPALAVKFMDKYSLGLAFNLGGLLDIRRSYSEVGTYDSLDADTLGGYYEHWVYTRRSKFSSEGSFLQVGIFAEPIPQLGISFSYRSGLDWGWRWGGDTLRLSVILWEPVNGWDTLSGRLIQSYDDSSAFKIPGIYTFGIRSKILPFLTLASELETRPFREILVGGSHLGTENGVAFRIGSEINTPLMIRAGFYSEAIPQSDSGSHKPRYLNGFTAGLGIPIASVIVINGCFEYATWNSRVNQEGDLYRERFFRIGTSLKILLPVKN